MMPKLPSRAALLVPVLSLGLLVPGFSPTLTQADALPTPCGMAAAANPDEDAVLLLSIILPEDPAIAAAPPLPLLAAPPPPGVPVPPGGVGVPKPLGSDLRPPDAALLNQEPLAAARQLQESLTEKQKAALRSVLTKHQGAPQQVRARVPGLPTETRGNKAVKADREATLNQVSTGVQRNADQIDQDIETLLTPAQRALLQKSRPKRLRSEEPATSESVVAERAPGC